MAFPLPARATAVAIVTTQMDGLTTWVLLKGEPIEGPRITASRSTPAK